MAGIDDLISSFHVLKKALVGLFRVVWEALRPRKFSIFIISFHTHTYPYRFELIAFVCGHLP